MQQERRAAGDDRVIPLRRVWVPLAVAHGQQHPIPVARLTYLAYLADWRAVSGLGKRLLRTEWFLDANRMPYSNDTAQEIADSGLVVICFGPTGTEAAVKPPHRGMMLSDDWRGDTLRQAIDDYARLSSSELAAAVAATPPVAAAQPGDELGMAAEAVAT